MIGNAGVIANLQKALGFEAQLQLQYHLDARLLKDMGLKSIKRMVAKFGEETEEFLENLTDRLIFFEGDCSYAVAGAVKDQPNVTTLLQNELALETAIVAAYQDYCYEAMEARDDNTRNRYEHLIKDHEDHIEDLEEQLELISGLGEKNYIAAIVAQD